MKKIKEYFIVHAVKGEAKGIEDKVQEWIELGYQPFGNLCVTVQNGQMYFYQPMVKYEE